MPLVIDMTLNGPLNRVPRRRVEKETVGTLINQLNLGQPDTLINHTLSLVELWMEPADRMMSPSLDDQLMTIKPWFQKHIHQKGKETVGTASYK